MEAKLKDKQSVEATVEVKVPAAEVDKAFDRVLKQLARQVRIPGFRPGKAPRGVLINRIGRETLVEEVREDLVQQTYPQAMRELDLAPIHAHIHGENPVEGEDYVFDFHVDLYPDIDLPPLEEIIIDTEGQKVDDAVLQSTIERLRNENATLVPVDRPSQPGDQVLIETLPSSDEEAGEESDEPTGSVLPIDLDTVGEELAQQLVGKSAGDVVTLTFGAPTAAEEEEGATADAEAGESPEGTEASAEQAEAATPAREPTTMRVRISDVKEKEKPAADDDFARTLGFETWAEAEEQIRRTLQEQFDGQAFEEQRDEFVEKLVAGTSFDLPNRLVQQRQLNLLENLTADLRRRDMSLEQYFQSLEEQGGREEFEKELLEAAQNAVRRDLVLERLMELRGTQLSEREFTEQLRLLAQEQGTDVERLRRERGEEWLDNYRFLLTRDRALNEAVEERLAAQRGEESGAAATEEAAAPEAAEDTAASAEPEATPEANAENTTES